MLFSFFQVVFAGFFGNSRSTKNKIKKLLSHRHKQLWRLTMKMKADENFVKYEHGVCVNKNDLIRVGNNHAGTSMWLYFNPADVRNYNKANALVHDKFNDLINGGVELARQEGQAGIKKLTHCMAEVEYRVEGKLIKQPIEYEVKISKSPARVGLICLQPSDKANPPLLVATIFMEDGLHKGKSKKYSKKAYLLDKHGLFKDNKAKLEKSDKQEDNYHIPRVK